MERSEWDANKEKSDWIQETCQVSGWKAQGLICFFYTNCTLIFNLYSSSEGQSSAALRSFPAHYCIYKPYPILASSRANACLRVLCHIYPDENGVSLTLRCNQDFFSLWAIMIIARRIYCIAAFMWLCGLRNEGKVSVVVSNSCWKLMLSPAHTVRFLRLLNDCSLSDSYVTV